MKYLELAALDSLNNVLLQLETVDQNKIYGRAEAYSFKFAGNDKKLYKRMSDKIHQGETVETSSASNVGSEYSGNENKSPSKSSPNPHPTLDPSHKTLYYLISCLNLAFPDYEFSDLSLDAFVTYPTSSIQQIVMSVNTTLYNVSLANSPVASFPEFSRSLWLCLDDAISLDDCEVYSYIPDQDANPFCDGSLTCLWTFNYIFLNKRLKRILLFYCRSSSSSDTEEQMSVRSITPFNASLSQSWMEEWKSPSDSAKVDTPLNEAGE